MREELRIKNLKTEAENLEYYEKISRYLSVIQKKVITRHGEIPEKSDIGLWLSWALTYVESKNPVKKSLPVFSVDLAQRL